MRKLPYAAVILGSVMLGTVPIFVRLAQAEGVPTLAVSTMRLGFGAALLAPVVLLRHRDSLLRLTRRELALSALAGISTTLFFFLFFGALEFTSVLIAGVLSTTNPLWVAFMEVGLLRTRLNRSVWIGLFTVLAGSVLFGLSGMGEGITLGSSPLLGGAMALLAAWGSGAYFLMGRVVRSRVPALVFLWVALLSGSLFALAIIALTRTPLLGYGAAGYVWILLMTLCAQIVGQVAIIYSLAYLQATLATIIIQFSVIISAVLAVFIFHEHPQPLQLVASAVILFGVTRVLVTPSAQTAPV